MITNRETIGAMLTRIGGCLGKKFTLDSQGALTLSYAGNRSCVFAAQDGFRPRIGMTTSLISGATDDQILRASLMNANLERASGVLALDSAGALVFTAARDAEDLSQEELAHFLSDFMRVSIELSDALTAPKERRGRPPEAVPDGGIRC
ncbi:MAG: CesT family type III secretion system chaperone [Methylocystis sp.]|uniref:CesT family type III secretion system chaperone n=1 Tax=Methylocystis sp. TaxID=1911079 RepID=UPI003DA2D9AC